MAKRSLIRSAGAALSSVALAAALVPMAAFAEGGTQLTAWTEIDLGDSSTGPSIVQVVSRAISAAAAETATDGILADAESLAEAARTAGAKAAQDAQEESQGNDANDQQVYDAQDDQTSDPQEAESEEESLGTQAIAEDPQDDASEAAADGESDEAAASEASTDGSALTAQKSIKDTLSESDESTEVSTQDESTSTQSGIPANSVVWAYSATDATSLGDVSAVVSNGTVELISVAVNGTTTNAATLISNASTSTQPYFKALGSSSSSGSSTTDSASGTTTTDATNSDSSTSASTDATTNSSAMAGTLCAPANATVTVKLMPSRGYQLTGTSVTNADIALVASESQTGYYTFTMPSEGTPFACAFTATQDVVETDSDVVTAGSISNAASAVANGTLKLEIEDIDDATAKKGLSDAAAKLGAKSSDIVANVDMKLSNVIYQGDDAASWDTALTDLSSPITLTLTLSNNATSGASAFYIVREHNGTYTNATATYDSTAKTITFASNAFSDFAIVKGTPSSSGSGNNSSSNSGSSNSSGSTTPTTGDTNDPVPFTALAIVAGAVAAFAVVRICRQA